MSPAAYLASRDEALNERIVASLLALLTEYRPLTEAQRERQRPEDARRWEEAAVLERRFEELKQEGGANRFSPDWIHLAFDCGERIEWRPNVQEAVAPYKTPATPETRTLSADEARDALERDWLFQADGHPTPERIREEIRWARRLAARIEDAYPGEVDFSGELKALTKLSAAARKAGDRDSGLYLKVRAIKRRILFANPAVDFDRMLFVDMPFPEGSEWPHETRHRLGYMAVPGARLLILDGLSPEGSLTQLMPQAPLHGSLWRPDLSFDAAKVLFCFKPHNEKAFHLYEINRGRHRTRSAHRRRLRRPRSDLPARRPHPLQYYARPHLRAMHAAHERIPARRVATPTARTFISSRVPTNPTTSPR